ncbi:Uncharacterized protein HSRCO_2061 [Halanaeroarchaeum sp. HSR-CO]|uniref:DUF7522 family protein n=1 Tax=Halanaeroarchaeum sp. HSR-CO TaxID=2866382 RepID=UPI00217EA1CF|nr:hypothetical protein [Halanaeroarchaeum sp. HSR-CO]UWG48334.1 Uncharacterized protein HSRCO_2061 [Halanaeroarchaeum sp. HSR-CO]
MASAELAPEGLASQITSACRTAAGDDVRSVTYFNRSDFEQIYLRSDLTQDADLGAFVEHETLGFDAAEDYRGSELGNYTFTVRRFDNGFLTRVIRGGHGVFVTLDSLTINRSEEIASALEEILEAEVE